MVRASSAAFLALVGTSALATSNFSATEDFIDAQFNVQTGQVDEPPFTSFVSPIVVPAPNITGAGDWSDAVAKAKKYVQGLTLEELVNITTGQGLFGRCVGNTGAITSRGFPGFCLEDSPTGVRLADLVSVFPPAINAAATFDKDLMRARGAAMGAEFRGKGVNFALGPMANLARAPAAGRNWEGFGADPFMSGVGAYETTIGIQSKGVIAVAKHYIANEQEHFRGGSGATASSSNINDRTMHELYLHPFAEMVRAGVGSVMCSYQRVNQTHACENSKILNGLLKDELNFQGSVMSDWGAQVSGVSSALAGLDMTMPGFIGYGGPDDQRDPAKSTSSYWGAALVEAVNNGSVPITRVRDMVERTFAAYFKMGQDKDFPATNFNVLTTDTYLNDTLANEHVNVQADHYKLIREMGAASVVLLKNENNTLPLNASAYSRWGVFGSDAGPNPLGPNGGSDRATGKGTLAIGWGSGTANFPYLSDPATAIEREVRAAAPTAGFEAILDDYAYSQMGSIASQAGICLAFVSSASGEGYITVDGNEGDRNNLTLWNAGEDLINTVAGNCSNTVVVVHAVGAIDMEPFYNNTNITAIVWAGLPGQESGNSLADVMFGRVNPSGRLPYTIAQNRADNPADVLYNSTEEVPQITYSEELLIDYRHFDAMNITPRYEFGYGLSYTTFDYSSLNIRSTDMKKRNNDGMSSTLSRLGLYDDAFTVTFDVKNTGSRDGHEVSQLYLGFPESAGEPPKVLRGFERTYVKKGETKSVTIKLNKKALSVWDVVSQSWKQPTGDYKVMIGKSSRDIVLTNTITL